MALIPTKKIPQLTAYGAPLGGTELLEIWSVNTSRRITARDFVLPADSVVTVANQAAVLPGSRHLASSATVTVVDGGAGGTVTFESAFTGAIAGNPTGTVGLAAVNGVALTWMRSDAAPPLSQAIIPTWTGLHTFTVGLSSREVLVSSADPYLRQVESDAAVDNRLWEFRPVGEQLRGRVGNDAAGAFVDWLEVDRTLNVIDTINLLATTVQVNGVNVRDASSLFNIGTVPAARLPSSFSGLANPTASVGLAAVNGAATTAMRSDAAPALDQAIAPTWTAQHIFSLSGATNAAVLVSSAQPQTDYNETDAAANNRRWRWEAQGEQFLGRTVNDANSAAVTWIAIDRTLNVVDAIALTSTALTWNGNALLSTATAFANPTGTVGLTAVNGAATTAMRSDAAPPLSQSIAPTWTATHTYSQSGLSTPAITPASAIPTILWNETDAAADNRRWYIQANSETMQFGAVNDAFSTSNNFMTVDRTGATIDTVTFPSKVIYTHSWSTLSAAIELNSNIPMIEFWEADATANNRLWRINANVESFQIAAANDADTVANLAIQIDRTGSTVDSVSFPTTTGGSFLVGATASAIGNRVAQVSGGTLVSLLVYNTSTANPQIECWTSATTGDNHFIEFFTEASPTLRGSITYNRAGGLVAYNTTSDQRRKKNIRNSLTASDIIDAIKIRAFEWIDSNNSLSHWVIAQELNEVCPWAVSRGDDTHDWSVDVSKLIPLVVKEIQDLRARVRVVEQRGNAAR